MQSKSLTLTFFATGSVNGKKLLETLHTVKCIHVGHINNASDGMMIGPIACSVGNEQYR